MRNPAVAVLLSAVLVALAGPASVSAAADITIGGTGNAIGTMTLLGQAFGTQSPGTKVTVVPSLGTSGAFRAVTKGALDIGLSSRAATQEERKLGITSLEYARTPLVFVVSTKTRATALTLDQVVDIYAGKLATWPDGNQIRPVLRQPGDDNTRQLRAMSPALEQALSLAERRQGMPFAVTDQEAAAKTETIPGALGVSTLGLIMSEDRRLRALALDGVEPTADNGASGRYPHVKTLFLITAADPSPAVRQFIAFIQSPAGRAILTRTGHWIPQPTAK